MEHTSALGAISDAVRLSQIREGRESWFPSAGSLEWHFRRHRARYIEGGAVLLIRGSVFVRPRLFDEIFVSIAANEAKSLLHAGDGAVVNV